MESHIYTEYNTQYGITNMHTCAYTERENMESHTCTEREYKRQSETVYNGKYTCTCTSLTQAIRQAGSHLEVMKEWSMYIKVHDTVKESIHSGVFTPPPPAEKATPVTTWPSRLGPKYFLTPWKCSVFGVCCECQVHYLRQLTWGKVPMLCSTTWNYMGLVSVMPTSLQTGSKLK